MTDENAVSMAEFSRMIGCAKSYVTALKKAGRLALDDEGRVLVEETHELIWQTSDPNRTDVADRWAQERGQPLSVKKSEPISLTERDSKAQKLFYEASQAKLNYERAIGKMVERTEVEAAVEDVTSIIRQALEQMPHRTAPELVGKTLDQIRATLKQDIHAALSEMEREFSKRLVQIGENE